MDALTRGLVVGRAVVGTAAFVAPGVTARLFGLNVKANPQAPYLGRLFGVRDAAMAIGLGAAAADERGQWLRLGIACDLGDAVAGVLAGRGGQLPQPAAILVTATALAGAGAGVAALLGGKPAG